MAKPNITKILFEGREETLEIFDNGGDLVKHLTRGDNPVCPLLGSSIRIGRVLGKGRYGEAFLIEFDQRGVQTYALKKTEPLIELHQHTDADTTYKSLRVEGLSSLTIAKFNEDNPKARVTTAKKIRYGDVVKIPLFLISCIKDKILDRVDGNGQFAIRDGSIVCQQAYTEFIISLLMGNVYRSGKSINFIDTFYFATCVDESKKFSQYTFMELIDGGSIQGKEDIYKNHLDNLAIQTLHAIGVYQAEKIVHNDLHIGNIFIKKVDDDMVWGGNKVNDATHFEYQIDGVSIWIPASPYIVKIADWGFGCKYSTPVILNEDVMSPGIDQVSGAWMPNFYSESYDVIYSMASIARASKLGRSSSRVSKFMEEIMEEILYRATTIYAPAGPIQAPNPKREKINVDENLDLVMDFGTSRPIIDKLHTPHFNQITPGNILLESECMKKYMVEPPASARIVLLGEF